MDLFGKEKLRNDLENEKFEHNKTKKKLEKLEKKIEDQRIEMEKALKLIKEAYDKDLEEKDKLFNNFKTYGKPSPDLEKSYHELEKVQYTGVFQINEVKNFIEGWKIYDFTKEKLLKENPKSSHAIISTVGPYGKGKTFFHSKLCNIDLPHGITYHTRGLSIKIIGNKVLIDSEGYQTPIGIKNPSKKDIHVKKLDEDFISNVILDLTDIFLFVVQHMTIPEQEMLLKIKDIVKLKKNDSNKCHIYVIHNFSDVWNENDVKKLWNEEIMDIFEGEYKEGNEERPDYFVELNNSVRHFCLFNHYSKLEKENEKVFKFINDSINTFNINVNHESIIQRLEKSLDFVIPNFFPTESVSKRDESKNDQSKYIEFIDKKDITDINLEKEFGFIGMFKPTKLIKGDNFNRYLEGFGGTTKSELSIYYDEIIEDSEFRIIFDTPGLDESLKNISFSQGDEMEFTEFTTKSKDKIKIGIMYINTGVLDIYYERSIFQIGKKRDVSRPEGIWRKKIDIPLTFKTFDTIIIYAQSGQMIIKIPKKLEFYVQNGLMEKTFE